MLNARRRFVVPQLRRLLFTVPEVGDAGRETYTRQERTILIPPNTPEEEGAHRDRSLQLRPRNHF